MYHAAAVLVVASGMLAQSAEKVDQQHIGLAVAGLKSKNTFRRWQSVTDLRRSGNIPKEVYSLLADLVVGDEDEKVRNAAAFAFASDKAMAASQVKKLAQAIKADQSERVKIHIGNALASIGPKAAPAVEALLDVVKTDESDQVRSTAAHALSKIGKAAVMPLSKLLGDKDHFVRRYAAEALGNIGSPANSVIPTLITLLNEDEDRDVRVAAFTALVKLDTTPEQAKRAIPTLVEVLQTGQPQGKIQAAWALGRIGAAAQEALPQLEKATKDEDRDVRTFAAEAIQAIKTAAQQKSKD